MKVKNKVLLAVTTSLLGCSTPVAAKDNPYVKQYCSGVSDIAALVMIQHQSGVPIDVQHIKIEKVVNDGEEYLVAFDPKIRKLLGINEKQLKDELSEVKKQRDLFERHNAGLKKGNIELFHRLEVQYNQLCMFTTMSFWKRLVFLFTGKV